ncbi:MAG: hypothetical protein GXY52_06230 [Chloroflexi bacterium]|nr:hypothetical protein [Chloroflexota bacterium]
MSRREQLWATVGFVVLGLLLTILVTLPTYSVTLTVLGSELALHIGTNVQFALVVTLLVCLGSEFSIRSHPDLPDRSIAYTVTFWVLPAIVTISSYTTLPLILISGWPLRGVFILGVGLLLYLVFSAQYHSLDRDGKSSWLARLVLQTTAYLAVLVFMVQISSAGLRAIVSSTAVWLVSSLLALELVRELETRAVRVWLYALLVGLMMAEFRWVMNYIRADARIEGTALLLFYYFMVGLVRVRLQRRLTARIMLEYSIFAVLGFVVLAMISRSL